MNNYGKTISIIFLVMVIFLSGCDTQTTKTQTPEKDATILVTIGEVQKVEVYHFHGNTQCSSCIAVGKLAEETVNTYFADELKTGKIVFAHVNAQLPENLELAKTYEVTGSSLWIGVYAQNGFHKEENVNVWYKINDKEDYMSYLKGILEKRLSGDLS